MDLKKLKISDLKKMRDAHKQDLINLKGELEIIRASINNSDCVIVNEIQDILKTRCSKSNETRNLFEQAELRKVECLKAITGIDSLDITVKPVKNKGEANLYLYTCKMKYNKLCCELEYESNLSPNDKILCSTEESITKLNLKILSPNLQQKLQKGIDFNQQSPIYFSNVIVFLKSLHDSIESRTKVIEKLYEYEKNIVVGVSKNSDQHSIIYKSEFDQDEFLHIKWNLKFNQRTGKIRDFVTAKIVRADDQLMVELKTLVEKLCGDKFALEATSIEKINIFRNILIAIKDADSRIQSNTLLP